MKKIYTFSIKIYTLTLPFIHFNSIHFTLKTFLNFEPIYEAKLLLLVY